MPEIPEYREYCNYNENDDEGGSLWWGLPGWWAVVASMAATAAISVTCPCPPSPSSPEGRWVVDLPSLVMIVELVVCLRTWEEPGSYAWEAWVSQKRIVGGPERIGRAP